MDWYILAGFFYCILCCILACILNNNKRRPPRCLEEVTTLKGLPFLGIVPLVKSPLYHYLMILRITYGKLFKLRLGMRDIIVVNDFQMTKKLIKDNKECLFSCWKSGLSKLNDERELVFKNGGTKTLQQTFIVKILNNFISEKSKLNEIVESECEYLLNDLKNLEGKDTDISTLFPIYTVNIITKIIMNKRFLRDDSKSKICQHAITIGTKNRDIISLLYLMFPQFDHSVMASKCVYWLFSKLKIFEDLNKIFVEEISDHLENCDGVDFISQCLMKENDTVGKEGVEHHFIDAQLLVYAYDFITAGYNTISSILEWSLFFMSKYPDIQERVHKEIGDIVGFDRMITMDDKKALNYTRAVMDEILRIGSPTPLRNVYKVLKQTNIDSYDVSKDNLILVNSYACNMNSNVWANPFDFNPQRFLSKPDCGKSDKYLPREELVIFGLDPRQFFGESLAKRQFFIFFTGILQRFQICFRDNKTETRYKETLHESEGVYRSPNIKNFIFNRHDY